MIDLSDMGLAQRFREPARATLRHCDALDAWYTWDGYRWRLDETQERYRIAKAMIEALRDEVSNAADMMDDDRKRAALWSNYNSRRSHAKLAAMLQTIASEPGIATHPRQWDAKPTLIQTPDGIVDLTDGTIRPATQDDLLSRCTTVSPDADADCPRWIQFLQEVTCGRRDLVDYLRAAIGMTLIGVQRDQVIMLCSGIGSNGKSKLIETLVEMLGDYAGVAMPNLLSARSQEAHPTELMALEGKRLVYCDEVKDNRLDESKVKRMTGGRQLTARGISQDPRTFDVQFSIWADCNERPSIVGTDDGIWRRIRLIPFEAQFRGETRDPDLGAKLRAELPAIMAWAVSASVDYLREGLPACLKVDAATLAYRHEQDVMLEFLETCCTLDASYTVASGEIYAAVSAYLETIGFRPWSKRRVTSQLTRRGTIEAAKTTGGVRVLRGVALRVDWRSKLGLTEARSGSASWND
jgi:putative DNA primase/helicase